MSLMDLGLAALVDEPSGAASVALAAGAAALALGAMAGTHHYYSACWWIPVVPTEGGEAIYEEIFVPYIGPCTSYDEAKGWALANMGVPPNAEGMKVRKGALAGVPAMDAEAWRVLKRQEGARDRLCLQMGTRAGAPRPSRPPPPPPPPPPPREPTQEMLPFPVQVAPTMGVV